MSDAAPSAPSRSATVFDTRVKSPPAALELGHEGWAGPSARHGHVGHDLAGAPALAQ